MVWNMYFSSDAYVKQAKQTSQLVWNKMNI